MSANAAVRAKCSEIRKDGEPCQAYAVLGTGKCAGHNHLGVSANPRANQERSAAAMRAKAERRKKTSLDWAADKLEQHAEALLNAAVTAGKQGDIAATRWLFERVHGKPLERVEQVETGAADVTTLTPEQRKTLRTKLLNEHPDLLELVPQAERQDAGTGADDVSQAG